MLTLTHPDIPRSIALRQRMLADCPWAFCSDPDTDRGSDPKALAELIDDPLRTIVAIEQPGWSGEGPPPFVATATVIGEANRKMGHRAMIVAVYVEPAWRGHGFGKAVMNAAIDFAKSLPGVDSVRLAVSERSTEARKLYESLGFVAWGLEPDTVRIDGKSYDETHMLLRW